MFTGKIVLDSSESDIYDFLKEIVRTPIVKVTMR